MRVDKSLPINCNRRIRSCAHRSNLPNAANIPFVEYNRFMEWNVIFDPDFRTWFYGQEIGFQNEAFAIIEILAESGSTLGRPRVDTLKGSVFMNMKELRIQYQGEPWRILFAFDPQRQAILLVGDNKTGNKRLYEENLLIAERRYEQYLETLEEEN
jgi:hypothetical protein